MCVNSCVDRQVAQPLNDSCKHRLTMPESRQVTGEVGCNHFLVFFFSPLPVRTPDMALCYTVAQSVNGCTLHGNVTEGASDAGRLAWFCSYQTP